MLEIVTRYETRVGQTLAVEDEKMRGTQSVAFEPVDGGGRWRSTLEYELKEAHGPLRRADRHLLHPPALRDSLRRTLLRFGARAAGGRANSFEIACRAMFVFKAAVVGAGTMGGEIAQVIAAADIPVVLKDVDQKFVDQGLEKAEQVTKGQLGRLVKKEKITQEQADAQAEEILGRIDGTTEYDGFGDVDFVVEAVPEKMEIKQAVFAELDAVTPGHAILASNTSSLSISEMAEATLAPRQGRRLPLLLPGLDDAPDRGHRGRRDLPETMQAASTSPRRSGRCRSAAPRAPASS